MLRACVLLAVAVGVYANTITDGTTLLQTFLIHRHGDRTPVEQTISLTSDPEAVEAASAQYGYGQLTDLGKARAYKLGQFIRERYTSLLSPQYNKSEIYIRSTDSTRTKMTVLTAMAAVYPAYPGSWSQDINWVPVPYTTVPAKYDFNLGNLNCPNYLTAYNQRMMSTISSLDAYSDVMAVLSRAIGSSSVRNIAAMPYAFYDAFVSQINLGIPVSDEIAAVLPRLKEAAGVSADYVFGDEDTIDLLAGVLLNEFFTYASTFISGADTPRVRIYSAHDINVLALIAAAKIPSQGVPQYASAFALELRRVEATGQYVVLAIYKRDPSEDLAYLRISGCDLLCDLEQFHELVSQNLLDEDTWRTNCGFTNDLVVDDSSIN